MSRLIAATLSGTLVLGLCAAGAQGGILIADVETSGPGSVLINGDPNLPGGLPSPSFFNGVDSTFTGVGALSATFVVGHDPGTSATSLFFEASLSNKTPFDFTDVLFALDDPEGRGVGVRVAAEFREPDPTVCQRPSGVFLAGAITCGAALSIVEGAFEFEIPDPGPGNTYQFTFLQIAQTPEPAALGVLGPALLAVMAARRRRFRRALPSMT